LNIEFSDDCVNDSYQRALIGKSFFCSFGVQQDSRGNKSPAAPPFRGTGHEMMQIDWKLFLNSMDGMLVTLAPDRLMRSKQWEILGANFALSSFATCKMVRFRRQDGALRK
jgi:hypothetical protein